MQDLSATVIFSAVSGTHATDGLCLRQQGAGSAAVQALSPEGPGEFQAANEGQRDPGELRVGGSGGGLGCPVWELGFCQVGFYSHAGKPLQSSSPRGAHLMDSFKDPQSHQVAT